MFESKKELSDYVALARDNKTKTNILWNAILKRDVQICIFEIQTKQNFWIKQVRK